MLDLVLPARNRFTTTPFTFHIVFTFAGYSGDMSESNSADSC